MDMKNSQVKHYRVQTDKEGQRLDNLLISMLKNVPKSHIYKIIRKGEVRVNKKRAKSLYKCKLGDIVRIPLSL